MSESGDSTCETEGSDDEVQPPTERDRGEQGIDRDKLRLLIEFLREDKEDPVDVPTIADDDPPAEEQPPKKNRRKFDKANVIRNKNTDREMRSMVFRTPKSSSAEEKRTDLGESSGCSGDVIITANKPPKDSVVAAEEGEGRSAEVSTSDCGYKDVTQDEWSMINVMRAVENNDGYFCSICSITTPVEEVWINVVTSEVLCLNCFATTIEKSEESHEESSKKSRPDSQTPEKEANRREDVKEGEKDREKDVAGDDKSLIRTTVVSPEQGADES